MKPSRIVLLIFAVGMIPFALTSYNGATLLGGAAAITLIVLAITDTPSTKENPSMSTAARKARKRAGIPFTKPTKVPTPVEERTSTKLAIERKLDSTLRKVGGDSKAAAEILAKEAGL